MKIVTVLIILLIFVSPVMAGDEISINKQIQKSTGVVKLDAKSYVVDQSINLKSGVVLQGVPGKTKIVLRSRSKLPEWVPVVNAVGANGARVTGITFDMNSDSQTVRYGKGYHIGIFLKGCNNIKIDNCVFINGKSDGIRCKTCSNIKVEGNTISRMGHDGIYFVDSKGCSATGNKITTRTNSGVRDWNSINLIISKNTITSQQDGLGGCAGIQIEYSKAFANPSVVISGNTINKTQGPGVQLIAYSAGVKNNRGVTVVGNTFTSAGMSKYIEYTGGVVIQGLNGATITGNYITSCNNAGVLFMSGGTGTTISKNRIVGTRPHVRDFRYTAWTGHGICNRAKSKISISGNSMSGNYNGNFYP